MPPEARCPHLPPLLIGSTPVLVSQIPLPPLTSISYAQFVPTTDQQQQQHKAVELARQRIVNNVRQSSTRLLDSLLPIVRIGKEETALWVFAIGSGSDDQTYQGISKGKEKATSTAVEELEAFTFDGLQRRQLSRFTWSTLYTYCLQCVDLQTPCSSCFRSPPDALHSQTRTPAWPTDTLFPRASIRPIYTLCMDAVRDRLIDDICATSTYQVEPTIAAVDRQTARSTLKATRLGTGFLSIQDDFQPTWSAGWEHSSRKSTLVHTALHVSLSRSAIHIRPLPTMTTLVPLPILHYTAISCRPTSPTLSLCTSQPPLTPGVPLILAPYQTPAFYVSTHMSASIPNSLLAQFSDALTGLGAYCFSTRPRTSSPRTASSSRNPKSLSTLSYPANLSREPFIVVIVPLTNPQGEPKGVTALWPAHLVFVDTSTRRSRLSYLPEVLGTELLLTPPRGSGSQLTTQSHISSVTPLVVQGRHPSFRSSDRVSRSQRAFRALELSANKRTPGVPITATAKQAAGYVENVAREREKERERANQERVRKERDIKEGKSIAGPSVPKTASTNTIAQVSQTTGGTPIVGPSKTHSGSTRATISNATISNFFSKAMQGNDTNSFYPSPPDWDPITSTSGSGVPELSSSAPNASTVSTPAEDVNSSSNVQSQSGSNVTSQSIGDALDLGSDMGLRMNMDMNMNMGINLNGTMSFDMAVDIDATGLMDGTFGSFTEDDFNYFDSAPTTIPLSTPHMQNSLQGLHEEECAVDGWLAHGLEQTSVGVSHQLQDHSGTGVLQERTPTSVEADATSHDTLMPHLMNGRHTPEDDGDLLPSAPELVPSSPAKSPWSPGNPPTPSLELGAPLSTTVGRGMFEPIAFGKSHSLADGKYRDAMGKFAFPQQSPQCPPVTVVPGSPSSLSSDKDDGWKLRYDAVTDPRIGVIKRLRGVKRKLTQTFQYGKVVRSRPRDEEWESLYDRDDEVDLLEPSSSESEEEVEEPQHGHDCDDDESFASGPSRPSTPPATGLPLMATLLHTHFHHAHLLPLGTPMRTSYDDVSPNGPPPAPISVPTPVSPAAALGSASERNKTLELLAQAVAKEAVENDLWAEAWGISSDIPPEREAAMLNRGVSQAELRRISDLLGKVDGLSGFVPLSTLLDPPSSTSSPAAQPAPSHDNKLQLMHPPWISIGRAGLIHHMLPPAIRFWEKEGLGPRGGTKDVVAFALFEESDERSHLVERWLERVSRAYNARGLGTHAVGSAGPFERGLVPVQFEAVRKTLPNLISALPPEPSHIVIYIVAPSPNAFSFKSPALRTIVMSQKRVQTPAGQYDFDQSRVLIHFVPEYLVTDPHTYPTTRYVGLERLVTSVYDRLLRPTLRQTSRRLWEYSAPFERRFQVPAYVLARKTPLQTHLEWEEQPSLNVLDRHTFLQVGYCLSACGRWLLAACIDERGESHDLAVWSVPDAPNMNVNWVASNIWAFVCHFAQRADTEWRIVMAKLGEMWDSEVEVWMSHLERMASEYPGPPIHVSLVCAQNDVPLSFMSAPDAITKASVNVSTDSGSVFADVSSVTYSVFLPRCTPIVSPDLFCPSHYPSFVAPPETEDDADQPLLKSPIGALPLSTTALFRVPNETDLTTLSTLYIHLLYTYKSAKSTLKQTTRELQADITRNWYELSVLTRERWHFAQHEELPFHLAALQVMSDVLNLLASAQDTNVKEAEFLGR